MNHYHYMQVMPGIHCVRCHKTYDEDKIVGFDEIEEHNKICPESKESSPCTPECGNYYKHKCPACGQDVYGI